MKDSRNIAEMRIAPVYVYYRGSTASYIPKSILKGTKVGGGALASWVACSDVVTLKLGPGNSDDLGAHSHWTSFSQPSQ